MKVKIGKYSKDSERSVYVKIEKHDTYSLDHTLAQIILPCLIQLKLTKHGIPNEFVSDVGGESHSDQTSFDFYTETHDEAFNQACSKWDEVLDKMIWSFQQIALEDYEDQYHHGECKYDWVKTGQTSINSVTGKKENLWQIVDTNPDEHWYDVTGHRLHEDRIQEGLELFGKYYRHLWD